MPTVYGANCPYCDIAYVHPTSGGTRNGMAAHISTKHRKNTDKIKVVKINDPQMKKPHTGWSRHL